MQKQIHAYSNTPIRYNPYQYLPLYKMLKNKQSNLLITDEVGLGKTIEAGIIIDDYLQNNPSNKVLIICPAFLRDKWQEELLDKFYYSSYIFKGIHHKENTNNITILPISRLKSFIDLNVLYEFSNSLIIVDEAHYFRNNKSARFKYLKNIISVNKKARLVFMTATPVNNTELDYVHLLKLLENNYPVLNTNTTKLQAYIDLRKRTIHDVWIDLSPDEYAVYDETDELDSFAGTIYRHIGAGCLYSLVRYAENNTSFDPEAISNMKSILSLDNDEEFEDEVYFQINADLPKKDTKLDYLFDIVDSHSEEKIVIFAHYIETVLYIYDQLKKHFRLNHKNPECISYIYGNNVSNNIDIVNKKNKFIDVKKWFEKDFRQKVLICSDACKEGVNLNAANILINYDLPFNPSIVEQRIGRIDRMSQTSDMTIYNFHVNNTYDDRLNAILNMKLKYVSNISKYGVGNPLNINSEDADIIINKYIKYFENREYSNEDINILRKVFKQIGVKTPKIDTEDEDKKDEIKSKYKKLVLQNKQKIINWLSVSNSEIEKEILEEHYIELDDQLGLKKVPDKLRIHLNNQLKDQIIDIFNTRSDFFKILPVLNNINAYEESLEEYGERKELSREDIKDNLVINYKTPSLDNFIPYEIVKGWIKDE